MTAVTHRRFAAPGTQPMRSVTAVRKPESRVYSVHSDRRRFLMEASEQTRALLSRRPAPRMDRVMQLEAVPAQASARDSASRIHLIKKSQQVSYYECTYRQNDAKSKSRIGFEQGFALGATTVQVDTLSGDSMPDWMSNTMPAFQNFPDSTFDDLNLGGQAPFLSMDYSGIQARKEANLNRTIRNTSNLADCLPPQQSDLDSFRYSTKWGQSIELLEPQSESVCISKLSNLSRELYEHGNTIPPLTIYDHPPAFMGNDRISQGTEDCPDYSNFRVDETLRLTQCLIDIYPTFLNAFLPHPISQSSNAGSTWPPDRISNTYFGTAQNPSASSTGSSQDHTLETLDHASILLILSCHLRLINIYEALFHHMKQCYSQLGASITPPQATLNVPPLKIGNFTPPPSAAVPMQMLLVVQFASQLFNYAADLASEIGEPEQGTPQSDSLDSDAADGTLALTQATAENVKNRASKMSQELGAMRSIMLQSGHLA